MIILRVAFFNPQGNFDSKDSYWTTHPDFGGQLVYVKELAIAMASMGVKTDIITRRVDDDLWPEFSKEIDFYPGVDNLRIIRIPFGKGGFVRKENLWPHIQEYCKNTLAFYDSEKVMPNFVTTHYGDGGIAGAIFAKWTGIPYSFTAHSLGALKMDKLGVDESNILQYDDRFSFTTRIIAEGIAMKYSAVNIVSTSMERFEQYNHMLYNPYIDVKEDSRFSVIPPGVNTEVFNPYDSPDDRKVEERIAELFERFSRKERLGLPMIVSSSRLDEKKNHIGLLNAYVNSNYLRNNTNLIIITSGVTDPYGGTTTGSSHEHRVLRRLVEVVIKENLKDRVLFGDIRNQRELASLYRIAAKRDSVFCLTALYEPFGLAPLEAMACGLPAVATKNGGPSESLRDAESDYGVLVDPMDTESICEGLLSLLGPEKKDQLSELRTKAIKRVLSRFTWQSTAERYIKEIESRLNREFAKPMIPGWFLGEGELPDIVRKQEPI